MESSDVIAPFVMKIYQMVNDPSSDNLICWGQGNNSFVVVDPYHFSLRLLPAFFKHNNFSSFIRQLNTYGFRKVDPDRFEFANEWFLRGQMHLLKNIGRKKQNNGTGNLTVHLRGEGDKEDEIAMEIGRLKQEQKALESELVGMNKRLEATERRPEKLMSLLSQVAEDPEILLRTTLEKNQKRFVDKKRQRPLQTPPASSSRILNTVKCDLNEECGIVGSLPEEGVFFGSLQSPDTPSMRCPKTKAGGDGGGVDIDYFGGGSADSDISPPPPPYPFSLLGGGF